MYKTEEHIGEKKIVKKYLAQQQRQVHFAKQPNSQKIRNNQ
jgi:hypothetical protein